MKALNNIDKFYILMFAVLLAVAILVIYTFRGIFSSIAIAHDVEVDIPDSELQIDRDILEKAYEDTSNREINELNLR